MYEGVRWRGGGRRNNNRRRRDLHEMLEDV
jgi:hypothetical protein